MRCSKLLVQTLGGNTIQAVKEEEADLPRSLATGLGARESWLVLSRLSRQQLLSLTE